ncbi:MAG: pyruvate kinase [Candidatus Micrarchaeota archaeon]|nr:pyruvate kinase [Candidatus Micrarchaeota archaeon]
MIRTKIIVTYGPSISAPPVLRRVIKHADIIRINFSHGNKAEWIDAVKRIRQTSKEMGKDVALFADLPGPKVRVEGITAPIQLKRGDEVRFGKGGIRLSYGSFHKDARKGAVIEIGDGSARLHVKEIRGSTVISRALEEGVISNRKGVTLLGLSMDLRAPTETDLELAKFASMLGFDFVGISFVRSARDIRELRKASGNAWIIAKIEQREAVRNIDEIARAADAVMVARGDLAEQVSLEHIPDVQRTIIGAARDAGKPVIVATQLLTSMINNPMPTRAEVNDIASAVREGADCLMLSDETIIGKYPEAAVNFLARAARVAEVSMLTNPANRPQSVKRLSEGIALAAADLADNYRADCIFIPTKGGTTAKMVSRLRPKTETIALVMDGRVHKLLSVYYGIRCMPMSRYHSVDEMLALVAKIAKQNRIRKYIVVSGSPNKPGSTDTLKYIGDST